MRNLEAIESDLAAAREALLSVEGTPTEVYSRIVGYYRSVRNWNRGKREEYGERLLYHIGNDGLCAASPSPSLSLAERSPEAERSSGTERSSAAERSAAELRSARLLLFVRSSCPGCPPAIRTAEELGVPLELVNTDSSEGVAEAVKYKVMSAPTAILFSSDGKELKRAYNAKDIGRLLDGANSPSILSSLAAAMPAIPVAI